MTTHNEKYSFIVGLTGILIIAVVFPLYFKTARQSVDNTTIKHPRNIVETNSHKSEAIHNYW